MYIFTLNCISIFLELDMTGRRHLVLVIFMLLVMRQALARRGHSSYREKIKEKMGERDEEKMRREESRENSVVGWRRKRGVHGTVIIPVLSCYCIIFSPQKTQLR